MPMRAALSAVVALSLFAPLATEACGYSTQSYYPDTRYSVHYYYKNSNYNQYPYQPYEYHPTQTYNYNPTNYVRQTYSPVYTPVYRPVVRPVYRPVYTPVVYRPAYTAPVYTYANSYTNYGNDYASYCAPQELVKQYWNRSAAGMDMSNLSSQYWWNRCPLADRDSAYQQIFGW